MNYGHSILQDLPWLGPVGCLVLALAWIANLLLHIRRMERRIKRLGG